MDLNPPGHNEMGMQVKQVFLELYRKVDTSTGSHSDRRSSGGCRKQKTIGNDETEFELGSSHWK